jgi:hypothetical protein
MKKLLLYLILFFAGSTLAAQDHFVPVWTGNGLDHMNFYITKATIDGENMQAGDEIGIFDGPYCVGAGKLTAEIIEGVNYLALVASKNDAIPPEVNGYTPDNAVVIKLWDAGEQLEITEVEVSYISGTDIFSIGGTSSFRAEGSSPGPMLPVADAGGDQQVSEGDTVKLDGSGSSDPLNGTLTFSWRTGSGIVLDDSTSVTPGFVAPEVEEQVSCGFFLVVNNGSADSEPDTVVITVLDVNKIPVITGQSDVSTNEEVAVTLSVNDLIVEDMDNTFPDDFIMTVGAGEHYTVSDREVTPDPDFFGTLEIPVTVNDGTDESEPFNMIITVINVNDHPRFTKFPADTTIDRNSETLFEIRATDADPGDILNLSVSINPGISQHSLTETGNGEFELSVQPGDTDPGPVEVTLALTDNIIAVPVEQAFTINFTPTGLRDIEASSALSIRWGGTDGQFYMRNLLAESLDVEIIHLSGSIHLRTSLRPGQEAGITLPCPVPGMYLIRCTGISIEETFKVLLK